MVPWKCYIENKNIKNLVNIKGLKFLNEVMLLFRLLFETAFSLSQRCSPDFFKYILHLESLCFMHFFVFKDFYISSNGTNFEHKRLILTLLTIFLKEKKKTWENSRNHWWKESYVTKWKLDATNTWKCN